MLALLGQLEAAVEQYDLKTGSRTDIGDAGTHHARAEHRDLAELRLGNAFRAPYQLAGLALVHEGRANDIARDRIADQPGEELGFYLQRLVERHQQAFEQRGQDRDRRRIVALRLRSQQRRLVAHHADDIRIEQAGVGAIALLVPGAHRFRRAQNPLSRGFDQLRGWNHGIDHFELQRLGGRQALAFEQQRQGRIEADHAWQALRAAGTRQQTDRDLRQTDHGLRIIDQHAMMAGQRQLEAAAERQPVDRRNEGLAAGFHAPVHGNRRLARELDTVLDCQAALLHLQDVLEISAGHERGLG